MLFNAKNQWTVGLLFLGSVLALMLVIYGMTRRRPPKMAGVRGAAKQEFMEVGGVRNKCYDCEEAGEDGYKNKCFDCVMPVNMSYSIQHLQNTPSTLPKMGYI